MKSEKIDLAIDMLICMAIKDYAAEAGITEEEARNRLMSSNAVQAVYDPDNELWTEGPDELILLYKEIG